MEGHPVVVEPLSLAELTLPLRTVVGIENVEKALTPEFLDKLKQNLKQHVTTTAWKTAVEMMRSLMTVSLMKQLNWEGRNKGKIGFAKIAPKFSAAILDAAKEVTVNEFRPGLIRDKLMKVLVKAQSLEDKVSVVVAERPPNGNLAEDIHAEVRDGDDQS